jgi:hypothetical protein
MNKTNILEGFGMPNHQAPHLEASVHAGSTYPPPADEMHRNAPAATPPRNKSVHLQHTNPKSKSYFLYPPSRYNTPATLTLHLTPPIALIRTNQDHLFALLH